jgi:hypothetical protein
VAQDLDAHLRGQRIDEQLPSQIARLDLLGHGGSDIAIEYVR